MAVEAEDLLKLSLTEIAKLIQAQETERAKVMNTKVVAVLAMERKQMWTSANIVRLRAVPEAERSAGQRERLAELVERHASEEDTVKRLYAGVMEFFDELQKELTTMTARWIKAMKLLMEAGVTEAETDGTT